VIPSSIIKEIASTAHFNSVSTHTFMAGIPSDNVHGEGIRQGPRAQSQ
jgi:hypothetical protein